MAARLGKKMSPVCKYGRTFVSCKAFKVCNQLTHMYVQYILHPTHTDTHTWEKHFKLNVFWQGQYCDSKNMSLCGDVRELVVKDEQAHGFGHIAAHCTQAHQIEGQQMSECRTSMLLTCSCQHYRTPLLNLKFLWKCSTNTICHD